MSRWYGSINNRLEENHQYEEIKVGTGATEYLWSDRVPYEVTKVKDSKHIWIRRMSYERTDSNGMSECQDYKYFSDEKAPHEELVFKYNHWYRVYRYTDKDGKPHRQSTKINISFGIMERYYDYSF